MTVKQTAMIAGGAALIVSGTVLGLLWRFGVWQYMLLGHTDLRVIMWPSSVMLTVGWCSTLPGILGTQTGTASTQTILDYLQQGNSTVSLLASGPVQGYRFNTHLATALTATSFSISGWGSTAGKTVNRGTDQNFSFTVTESTGQSANPTFTLTFANGTWTSIPIYTCNLDSATTDAVAQVLVSATATALTVTYEEATPANNKAVTFQCVGMGT
jgi:hypothetical protein